MSNTTTPNNHTSHDPAQIIAIFWKHNWQWFLVGIVGVAIPIVLWAIFGPIKRHFQKKARNSVPIFWDNVGRESHAVSKHRKRSTSLGGETLVEGQPGHRTRSGSLKEKDFDVEAQMRYISHEYPSPALPSFGLETNPPTPPPPMPPVITITHPSPPPNTRLLTPGQTLHKVPPIAKLQTRGTRSHSLPVEPANRMTYLGNPRLVRHTVPARARTSLQAQQPSQGQFSRSHHLSLTIPKRTYDTNTGYRGVLNHSAISPPYQTRNIPTIPEGPFAIPVRYCPPVVDTVSAQGSYKPTENVGVASPDAPTRGWPLPE